MIRAQRSPRIGRWLAAGCLAAALLITLPFLRPARYAERTSDYLATETDSHGFYPPQTDAMGNRYGWTEPYAYTRFTHLGNLPVDVDLRLRSAAVAGGPAAPVHVLVDDREVAELTLDSGRAEFRTLRVPLPASASQSATIALRAEPFRPPKGDNRVLGTMVQSIVIDRQAAWSSIARWSWLYWILPFLGASEALLFGLTRRTRRDGAEGAIRVGRLRRAMLAPPLAGVAAMVAAIALLAQVGNFDPSRYGLWVVTSIYLAGFFAALALHLPLGAQDPRSVWHTVRQSRLAHRLRPAAPVIRAIALIALMIGATVVLLGSPGTGDLGDKVRWMHNIAANGLIRGFAVSRDDYPPGTYVVLAIATAVASHTHASFFIAYKVSLTVFLFLISGAFLLWTRSIWHAAALHLALLVGAVSLGYNDVYFALPLMLALWALSAKKPAWFVTLFALACLMKWQPLMLAPVLFLYACFGLKRTAGRSAGVRRLMALVLPGLAVGAAALTLFGGEVVAAFHRATTENFLSANALNVHWITTQMLAHMRPDQFGADPNSHRRFIRVPSPLLLAVLKVPCGLAYGWVVYRFIRGRMTFTAALTAGYAAYVVYFLLNTSVHENHLVPALVVAAALWWRDARYGVVFLLTAGVLNLNLWLFYGMDGAARLPVLLRGVDVTLIAAVLVVGTLLALVVSLRSPRPTVSAAPHPDTTAPAVAAAHAAGQ